MNRKVIPTAAVLAVCIALSGCAENPSEAVAETSSAVSAVTSSAASETEDEETSLTTSQTDTETEKTTAFETEASETEPTEAVPKIEIEDLKAVRGEKLYSTPECKITENFVYENEADFPAPEHIELALKAAAADGETDIYFAMGTNDDYDGDGENESFVVLDPDLTNNDMPDADCLIYYIDGKNAVLTIDWRWNAFCKVYTLDFGTKRCVKLFTIAGVSGAGEAIYYTDGGTLEEVCRASEIEYLDGMFQLYSKSDFGLHPVILCEDGKFRYLGEKEITEDDFAAHFENGREYLEYLRSEGNVIDGIYTTGYCKYRIGEAAYFSVDGDGNVSKTGYQDDVKKLWLDIKDEEIDYDIDVSKLEITPYSE